MAIKRNALGRGLDSLISVSDVQAVGTSAITEIRIDSITPNPNQPRRDFDEESLEELAVSIRELGVVQPLTLRETDGSYQIIAGERRWRAAKKAGLTSVPAYVRKASDTEMTEMALIENIQREDLNAIEVALAFKNLIVNHNITQVALSERLGKNRATISNHLRLLKLPADIQLGLRDRKLEMGHAKALLSLEDPKDQLRLYNLIIREGLSVRRVEDLVRQFNEKAEKPDDQKEKADYSQWIEKLKDSFHLPVKISGKTNGKGSVNISFKNEEELRAIIGLLIGKETTN